MTSAAPKNAAREATDNGLHSEFRQLAESIAGHFSRFGVAVKPYHHPSLPHFSRLSAAKKREAVHHLRLTWKITQDQARSRSDEAENDATALWSALKVYELTPGNDLFRRLEGDDKIEIYNLEGIQIWRNCNVMEICSYTLEEIHSFDWQERYERSDSDNQAIVAAVTKAVGLGSNQHLYAGIRDHLVAEKFSELRFHLKVRHDYFFPLFGKNKRVAAFLVTSKVEILPREAHPPAIPGKRRLSLVEPADLPK